MTPRFRSRIDAEFVLIGVGAPISMGLVLIANGVLDDAARNWPLLPLLAACGMTRGNWERTHPERIVQICAACGRNGSAGIQVGGGARVS